MTKVSEHFVAYGFVKKGEDKNTIVLKDRKLTIEGKTGEDRLASIRKLRDKLPDNLRDAFNQELENMAEHEWVEVAKDQLTMSDYPKSATRYFMNVQSFHNSIEPYYYWCINFLSDLGFPVVDKITDVFTAAEHSSFYGAGAQRLGLAQDKVSQYLATIGKMIKDLFQLVRELRWIDERLDIYRSAFGIDKEGKKTGKDTKSGEMALKGLWVDLVDGVVGGQRTGTNLFIMAQQLQFTTLPDLFFAVTPKDKDDVDKAVEQQAGKFNEQVKNALLRKLKQYMVWRESTYAEMQNRRKFTIKYVSQHYQVIKMYINWIKPYIKHIQRLSGQVNLLDNPRLVSAFESSLVELEILARQRPPGSRKSFACILLTFEYHTQPAMSFPGDSGYHRGPIHVGSTRITWRSYGWTDQQVADYKAMKSQQDLELVSSVDDSLKSAMDALGDDLFKYLKEAEGEKKEETIPEKTQMEWKGLFEPFTSVGKGFGEVFGGAIPKGIFKAKKPTGERPNEGAARKLCWVHYNIFKKAHGLLAW